MTKTAPIVVGVNGSTASNSAVRYAAHRAVGDGRRLHLVHVPPTYVPAGFGLMSVPYVPAEFEAVGRELLNEATDLASAILPREQIAALLLHGPCVSAINTAAKDSSEVVLGADHASVLERYAAGSVVAGVAAGSYAPVIVVPDAWSAPEARTQRIVVGVKHLQSIDLPLLRAAFEAGHERGAMVDLVHVWHLPQNYIEAAASLPEYPAWQWNADEQIRHAIGTLVDEYPDVRHTVTTVSGRPVEVLRRRCEGATLLMLARRPHRMQHFGHTGHALLRSTSCPTEIVPVPHMADAQPTRSRRVAM